MQKLFQERLAELRGLIQEDHPDAVFLEAASPPSMPEAPPAGTAEVAALAQAAMPPVPELPPTTPPMLEGMPRETTTGAPKIAPEIVRAASAALVAAGRMQNATATITPEFMSAFDALVAEEAGDALDTTNPEMLASLIHAVALGTLPVPPSRPGGSPLQQLPGLPQPGGGGGGA